MENLQKKISRPIVVYDVETTSNDPKTAEIVQFAAVKISPKAKTQSISFLVKPSVEVTPGAAEVHGITNEKLADEKPFAEYADKIDRFFKNADVAGYNLIRFDQKILQRQMEQAGFKDFMDGRKVYDAYKVFCAHTPRKLTNAVHFYTGGELENAHDALADVWATANIINEQIVIEADTVENVVDKYCSEKEKTSEFNLDRYLIKDGNDYTLNFSKHKGTLLSEVDKGFIKWVLNKDDFPVELKEIMKRYL